MKEHNYTKMVQLTTERLRVFTVLRVALNWSAQNSCGGRNQIEVLYNFVMHKIHFYSVLLLFYLHNYIKINRLDYENSLSWKNGI
jgi:hypothetical protein